MTCQKLPSRVVHLGEIWTVTGGCLCCGLELYRMEHMLKPLEPKKAHRTTATPGTWTPWAPQGSEQP